MNSYSKWLEMISETLFVLQYMLLRILYVSDPCRSILVRLITEISSKINFSRLEIPIFDVSDESTPSFQVMTPEGAMKIVHSHPQIKQRPMAARKDFPPIFGRRLFFTV